MHLNAIDDLYYKTIPIVSIRIAKESVKVKVLVGEIKRKAEGET